MNKKTEFLIGAVVLLLFVGGFLYANYFRKSQNVVLINYADPEKRFSLKVPSDWTSTANMGTNKTGIGTPQEKTQMIEINTLYSGNGVGVTLQIYNGAPSCSYAKNLTTTLGGLPASFDPQRKLYIAPAADALYVVNYYYPGAGVYHTPPGAQISVPSESELATDKKNVDEIISSLKFTGAKPLDCP